MHFTEKIKTRLQSTLPGPRAQYRMAPVGGHRRSTAPEDARQAGVLALFYPHEQDKDLHLVLIERMANNPNDRHGGQVSFPGGKHEDQDPDMQATALRETEEEVGVRRNDIQVLGKLSELYIPVSNFQVHPYVGYIDYHPEFQPQPDEVQSILEAPLSLIRSNETLKEKDIKVSQNMVLKRVPYFSVREKVIWGATAMMLSELLEVIE